MIEYQGVASRVETFRDPASGRFLYRAHVFGPRGYSTKTQLTHVEAFAWIVRRRGEIMREET